MDVIQAGKQRDELVLRLKRVEGQLRGVQKMLGEGADCESVAQQMAASRKALDRAFFTMVGCMLEQQAEGKGREKMRHVAELLAKFA